VVELLYLAKAYENILRGYRTREGLVTTVVDERDVEVLYSLRATMVVNRGQSGNIEQANPARSSKTFFVARVWQSDAPPHGAHVGTNIV